MPQVLVALRLLPALTWLLLSCSTEVEPRSIANRSFVFISGFPQSGTSIMLQMFEVSGVASTMLRGCPVATKQPLLCFKRNGEGTLNCSCLAKIITSSQGNGCQVEYRLARVVLTVLSVHQKRDQIRNLLQPGHMVPVHFDPEEVSALRNTWVEEVL